MQVQIEIVIEREVRLLTLEGWEPGAPDEQIESLDRRIVEDVMICQRCGGDYEYHPFHRNCGDDRPRYKPLCVCKACGYVREL